MRQINNKSIKNTRGFTLVEMVAVLAILPIIMVLLHSTLTGTLDVMDIAEEKRGETQLLRSLRNIFKQDVEFCSLPKRKKSDEQINDDAQSSLFLGKKGPGISDTTLHLVTLRPSRFTQPALELNEVGYKIRRSISDPRFFVLMRREQALYDANPDSGGNWMEIYDRVLSLEIQYHNGVKWLEEWNSTTSEHLPYAVRISISIVLPGKDLSEAVRIESTVRIPASSIKIVAQKDKSY